MPTLRTIFSPFALSAFLAVATFVEAAPTALAGSQRFDSRIIVVGKEREKLKNTPIEKRPNRPLHVYGNAVRRRSGS
jgi:hypothetical protein